MFSTHLPDDGLSKTWVASIYQEKEDSSRRTGICYEWQLTEEKCK